MTQYGYRCYGLDLVSDLELPDLGEPAAVVPEPDLRISTARLEGPPAGAAVLPHLLWRTEDSAGFEVPEVGRYEIRDGRTILVDAAAGTSARTVRLFVLGSAIGIAMIQRGHLVLHGNAVRVGDACAVVVGHSGAGKSTLAAEFDRRGYDVLSDDVVPVDASGAALPGYPRIKLWEDALARIGRDTADLERVRAEYPKFEVPLDRRPPGPLPVRWIYVLERHHGGDLVLEPAVGAETFALLHEHTYRNELVHGPAATAAHLRQCAELSRHARITRVLRPAATMSAEATATAILRDLDPAGHP